MKLISKAKNGKMIKVGDNEKTAKFYYLSTETKPIADTLNVGDEVTIKWEQRGGSSVLTFLTKGKVDVPTNEKEETREEEKSPEKGKEEPKKSYGKGSQETSESIKRQAIAHATSRTLVAMQGLVNPDNVDSLIDKIYNKYLEKVG